MKIERFANLMITAVEDGLPCAINISGARYKFYKIHEFSSPEFRWSGSARGKKAIASFIRIHKGQEFRVFGTLESETGQKIEKVALNLDCEFVCSVLYESVERE